MRLTRAAIGLSGFSRPVNRWSRRRLEQEFRDGRSFDVSHHRPLARYRDESRCLLGVLETRLAGRDWIMGTEYSIADISMLGWVRNLIGFYEARELVGFDALAHVPAWLERGLARLAVQRGVQIPNRGCPPPMSAPVSAGADLASAPARRFIWIRPPACARRPSAWRRMAFR